MTTDPATGGGGKNPDMPSSTSPSIDNLEQTWRSIIGVCEGLTEEEWKEFLPAQPYQSVCPDE